MLTDIEQQIILYTKGHFVRTDTIEDLKKMIGVWSGMDNDMVTVFDVYEHVINAFVKTVPESRMVQFFKELFRYNTTIDISTVIQKLSGFLASLQVWNGEELLIDLGEPDYNLLPKKVSNY